MPILCSRIARPPHRAERACSRASQAVRSLVLSLAALAAFSLSAHAEISGRATVIDGDTIAVEGTDARIRLYGIDAPESQQTCDAADGKRYLCGSRAADALAEIIGRNGRVQCFEEDRDRYGRIVAECLTQGNVGVNAAMVSSGWAFEYVEYSDGRYSRDEESAKSAKTGMWAGKFVQRWDWRRGERIPSEDRAPGSRKEQAEGTQAAQQQSCKAVSTCEEAVQMWCGGYSRADGDDDGVPCENVCSSG